MTVRNLHYRARVACLRSLTACGLGAVFQRNRSGRRLINYHGVDERGSTQYNGRFISRASLEQHLAYFTRHFNVVTLTDYLEGAWHAEKLTVCLTFDDGYRNNLKHVLPLLEKYQAPASFFVTAVAAMGRDTLWPDRLDLTTALSQRSIEIDGETFRKSAGGAYVSERGTLKQLCVTGGDVFSVQAERALAQVLDLKAHPELAEYWQLMTQEEIRTLSESPLVTVGSHGVSHCSFEHVSRDVAREEMQRSKTWLEDVTGKEVNVFAYPFGHYTRENLDDAEALGFTHQLALDFRRPEDEQDPRLYGRFGVNPYIEWDLQLIFMLNGRY